MSANITKYLKHRNKSDSNKHYTPSRNSDITIKPTIGYKLKHSELGNREWKQNKQRLDSTIRTTEIQEQKYFNNSSRIIRTSCEQYNTTDRYYNKWPELRKIAHKLGITNSELDTHNQTINLFHKATKPNQLNNSENKKKGDGGVSIQSKTRRGWCLAWINREREEMGFSRTEEE